DLDQPAELRLGHELGILGPKRRGEDVDTRLVLRRVAGELVRIELSRSGDEIEDRLLRLDSEHDRSVAELQVEIEEQRSPPGGLRERGGEVRRDHRLARPAFRREHRDDAALAIACGCGPPRSVRRLSDREDDVLRQRGEQHDVGDVGPQRVVEQCRRLAGREHEQRYASELADCGDLVRGQRRRARAVQDTVEVPALQGAGCIGDLLGGTNDLDPGLLCKSFAELLESFARARQIDADSLAHRIPTPSLSSVSELSYQRGLLAESAGGRISRRHSWPYALIHSRRCDSASVRTSWTAKPPFCAIPPPPPLLGVVGAETTSRSRRITRETLPPLPVVVFGFGFSPSDASHAPTTST